MGEDTAKEETLFLLLRKRPREQKCKKKCKKPSFGVREFFRQREQYGENSK